MLTPDMRETILMRYVSAGKASSNKNSNANFWAELEVQAVFNKNKIDASVFNGYPGIQDLIRRHGGTSQSGGSYNEFRYSFRGLLSSDVIECFCDHLPDMSNVDKEKILIEGNKNRLVSFLENYGYMGETKGVAKLVVFCSNWNALTSVFELCRRYYPDSCSFVSLSPLKVVEEKIVFREDPLAALASAIDEDQHGEALLTVGAWFQNKDIHVRTILPLMDTYGLWKNLLNLYGLNKGDAVAKLVSDLSGEWEKSGHKSEPTSNILNLLIVKKKGFAQMFLFDFCEDLIRIGNANLTQIVENLKNNIQERQKTAKAEGQANFNAQTGLREWLLGGICKADRVDILVTSLQKEDYSEVKQLKKFTEEKFERYGFKGREAESAFERIQQMITDKEI